VVAAFASVVEVLVEVAADIVVVVSVRVAACLDVGVPCVVGIVAEVVRPVDQAAVDVGILGRVIVLAFDEEVEEDVVVVA